MIQNHSKMFRKKEWAKIENFPFIEPKEINVLKIILLMNTYNEIQHILQVESVKRSTLLLSISSKSGINWTFWYGDTTFLHRSDMESF